MVEAAAPRPPVPVPATMAVSAFEPLSIVMVWPAPKPTEFAIGMTVAPALVEAPTTVAPAVPTVAIVAISVIAPVSITIVWPGLKSATLATLILVAPTLEPFGKVVAAWTRKSAQLLSVSAPSGNRPALRLWSAVGPPRPPGPTLAGEAARQPLCPDPEAPW